MVDKNVVDKTLDYPANFAAEEFDVWDSVFVCLVSVRDGDPDDNYQAHTRVGISYLIPRAYTLLKGLG